MSPITLNTCSRTFREDSTYHFDVCQILYALREVGMLPNLPDLTDSSVKIEQSAYVRVPGGGDWAGTDLGLEDHPLVVRVVTEKRD